MLPSDESQGTIRFGPVGRALVGASKAAALIGGTLFIALIAMSLVSIVGRKLMNAPVPGDVELLQLAAAIGSSTFFAWCHLAGGDVKVDFFTRRLRPAVIHRLDAVGSLLVGGFGALVAWRTAAGAWTVLLAGEETMILGLPQWWGPALMVPGFVLLGLAGFYRAARHLDAAADSAAWGKPQVPVDGGKSAAR
jgi:TRAP-type C4-dicarboxylate transport system permease small subunit